MFLGKDFLLKDEFTKKLYHNFAQAQPIIDYHCHLKPKEIYENLPFPNITATWLYGDHYKWRLMRANGIAEELITGTAPDYDKFLAWAETIENCLGNPLYVWTHLELQRIFGIDELLTRETAPLIWEKANKILAQPNMTPREIIKKFAVKIICTTDNPTSDLHYHKLLANEEIAFKVFPTFRPDKPLNIDNESFGSDIKELSACAGVTINSYDSLLMALEKRILYFHENGCRLSDHGLGELIYEPTTQVELNKIFVKVVNGGTLTDLEIKKYKSGLLVDLMMLYHKMDWTAQLRFNATQNNNTTLFKNFGPNNGGDAMGDGQITAALGQLLDELLSAKALPKTILYSVNPKDFAPLTALMGCFQSETKGKIQLGAAWWFNDTYYGMRQQMITLAEGGILGNFVGMLTDSRSFLSYPRHEYFRRILCELIGEWVASGQLPANQEIMGKIVKQICYNNAEDYFNF
jgi:Glucuronate isomerase